MLMLQYVSGGKWGLLLRRPLEAMTRTLPLVALLFIPILIPFSASTSTSGCVSPPSPPTQRRLAHGLINKEQALTANFKHTMLNPHALIVEYCIIFAVLLTFMFLLNSWSLAARRRPAGRHLASYDRWRTKFENSAAPAS